MPWQRAHLQPPPQTKKGSCRKEVCSSRLCLRSLKASSRRLLCPVQVLWQLPCKPWLHSTTELSCPTCRLKVVFLTRPLQSRLQGLAARAEERAEGAREGARSRCSPRFRRPAPSRRQCGGLRRRPRRSDQPPTPSRLRSAAGCDPQAAPSAAGGRVVAQVAGEDEAWW